VNLEEKEAAFDVFDIFSQAKAQVKQP